MPGYPPDAPLAIAERFRLLARSAAEPRKQRLIKIADMCELEPQLINGSRRAIAESRALMAAVERLLQ